LLNEKDVRELISLKCEGKNLDYKQSLNWKTATPDQKAAIIKDVLAMANTQDGGKIIFGIRDRDFEPVGLTDEEFQSFDATPFGDFLSRYADPPFACVLHKYEIDGKRFVVVEIPEFNAVPIICKADANDGRQMIVKRGALYVRTHRAASEAVPDAETMRDLMNRAVVKRGDELLRMVERLIKGKPIALDEQMTQEIKLEVSEAGSFLSKHVTQAAHWEVESYVLPYLRDRIPTLASVSGLLTDSQVTLRGWYFPHLEQGKASNFNRGVQFYMNWISEGHLEGYRAYQSGVFVWRSSLWEDTIPSMQTGEKALSFIGVILEITEFFLFAKRYYEKLSIEATISLTIRLTDTENRTLKAFGGLREGFLYGRYTCREPRIEIQTECTVAQLAASYDELARNAIRRVYELFNWNTSDEEMMRSWQGRLLNRGL
jgi:hypothetical protein